ncbi:MAG: hypothetical protein BGO47_06400 [Microbacterium sp. 67-17]|uniref:hypothetical protein n=1 Tax=Microbacterium sp. 67-17 TaxID=1895782 RepID=UPI00096923AA|nr:hypothetical protein [Microbacterium sp. 67-17]OJV93551.1 MAG: hypothetical protein BGO47_06400 [Microbacterium sp. 67-17]
MSVFFVTGALLVVTSAISAVSNIVELFTDSATRVFAEFAGTAAQAPIGPDGDTVTVELDSAYLLADQLPLASVVALVLEQAVVVAAVATVVTSLLLVMWSILRGRVFGRRNTTLIGTAATAGFAGVALAPFFGNMGANGAFAAISGGDFDNVVLSANLAQLFGIAFLGALGTTVFMVGDRMQRDTEGLV